VGRLSASGILWSRGVQNADTPKVASLLLSEALVFGPTILLARPASAAKTKTVDVKLRELKILPRPKSTKAGDVTFKVKNIGTVEHEFVVVKTDGAALPTAADG
jgi:uncharacterized cupredoxin-like copper-binding protein